jgi:urea transport system permease protein
MRARVLSNERGPDVWRTAITFAVLSLMIIVLAMCSPLRAQNAAPAIDVALEKFTADNFSDTEAAIAGIVAAAPANAQAILEALANRRLFFSAADKSVIYQNATGGNFDAKTANPIAALPADASPVRINNRLRGAVEAALGSMTLLAPEAAKRIQAADSIFKSRDVGALPALDTALAREKDPKVTRALLEARAAVVLTKPDATAADRVAAIDSLSKRGDKDAINLLRGAAASATQPEVKQSAEVAIANVERKLRVVGLTQDIYYGLSLGSVLLLAAIGLAITFGVMGIINMAHGEMVMLGAYTTYVVQQAFKANAPAYLDWALPLSIPLAFMVAGLVGIAIERGIIRFLYGRPLETLLATWGVSLILQQAIRNYFGASNVQVSTPEFMSGSFEFAGLAITFGRLWIIVFTLVVFACLLAMLKLTPLGLQMRAVTQNRRMASSMGIPTGRIDAMTFGLGSGIAGIAGVALSQIDNVAPNLGQSYIIDSFMVVVFGGVGNLWGTLVSAFALGIANKLLEPFAGAVLGKILILVLLILFIQKRPRGLFALKGRAVEA